MTFNYNYEDYRLATTATHPDNRNHEHVRRLAREVERAILAVHLVRVQRQQSLEEAVHGEHGEQGELERPL